MRCFLVYAVVIEFYCSSLLDPIIAGFSVGDKISKRGHG